MLDGIAAPFLGAIPEPCVLARRDGGIVAANAAAATILGRSAAQLRGMQLATLCEPQDEPIADFLRRCAGSGGRCIGSVALPAGDGGTRAMRLEGARIALEAGEPPFILLRLVARHEAAAQFLLLNERLDELSREVARRRRAEAELAARLEELSEADEQKNRFLALLSHELRNPLAPIRTMLHVMRRDPKRERVERGAAMMERHVTHLIRLVDDLLDLSRITTGKIRVDVRPVALGDVLEEAVSGLRERLHARGQSLRVDVAPLSVMADYDRLRQVFGNLLDNACKFTPEGGRIEVTSRAEGDRVVVEVRDSGPGVPAELASRLFRFFAQGESSNGRAQGGLGLGLALARNLAELQGGSLELAPDRGAGATFVVSIPAARQDADASPNGQQALAAAH